MYINPHKLPFLNKLKTPITKETSFTIAESTHTGLYVTAAARGLGAQKDIYRLEYTGLTVAEYGQLELLFSIQTPRDVLSWRPPIEPDIRYFRMPTTWKVTRKRVVSPVPDYLISVQFKLQNTSAAVPPRIRLSVTPTFLCAFTTVDVAGQMGAQVNNTLDMTTLRFDTTATDNAPLLVVGEGTWTVSGGLLIFTPAN